MKNIMPKAWTTILARLHGNQSGAATIEHVLILALVVIPLCTLLPMFQHMIQLWGVRIISIFHLPFP
jgi:Flp pilus assembly pilin Flp